MSGQLTNKSQLDILYGVDHIRRRLNELSVEHLYSEIVAENPEVKIRTLRAFIAKNKICTKPSIEDLYNVEHIRQRLKVLTVEQLHSEILHENPKVKAQSLHSLKKFIADHEMNLQSGISRKRKTSCSLTLGEASSTEHDESVSCVEVKPLISGECVHKIEDKSTTMHCSKLLKKMSDCPNALANNPVGYYKKCTPEHMQRTSESTTLHDDGCENLLQISRCDHLIGTNEANDMQMVKNESDGVVLYKVYCSKGHSYNMISEPVCAQYSQSNVHLYGKSAGKQCMCMAYCAGLYSLSNRCADDWYIQDIHAVMRLGNDMYCSERPKINNDFFCVDELPKTYVIMQKRFSTDDIHYSHGFIRENSPNESYTELMSVLNRCLVNGDVCLFTLKEMTFSIIKNSTNIIIFDSHNRDMFGCPAPDGNAIVLKFSNVRDVALYILHHASHITKDYEILYECARIVVRWHLQANNTSQQISTGENNFVDCVVSNSSVLNPTVESFDDESSTNEKNFYNDESNMKEIVITGNGEISETSADHMHSSDIVIRQKFSDDITVLGKNGFIYTMSLCPVQAENRKGPVSISNNCSDGMDVCIAYSATLFNLYRRNADFLCPTDLDEIMEFGYDLHGLLHQSCNDEALNIDYIPIMVNFFDSKITIQDRQQQQGVIKRRCLEDSRLEMIDILNRAMSVTVNRSCLFSLDNVTFAVLKSPSCICLFEPHSTDEFGRPITNGRSILLKFASEANLVDYVLYLYSIVTEESEVHYQCNIMSTERSFTRASLEMYRKSIETFKSAVENVTFSECKVCKRLTFADTMKHFHDALICRMCYDTCRSGKISNVAETNELYLDKQPDVISELSELEARMISRRLPFMKIVKLPRGGQRGIKGPVINVPSKITSVIRSLPRMIDESQLIMVKLTKRLRYEGYQFMQTIRPVFVERALDFLVKNNPLYNDIEVNREWAADANCLVSDEVQSADTETDEWRDYSESDFFSTDDEADNENFDNYHVRGLDGDTCLIPHTQVAPHNYYANNVLKIAPGEGETPLKIYSDGNCEQLAFPKLFPLGRFGMNCDRTYKLSKKMYFKQRLMNSDKRFATCSEYLFFAYFALEEERMYNSIRIAMKQRRAKDVLGHDLLAKDFKSTESMEKIFNSDLPLQLNFMRGIRGSPAYFQRMTKDLLAMIRQLGKPTFYCTFSSADLRWPEVIRAVASRYGKDFTNQQVKTMTWDDRCKWINSDPVTVVRMFYSRMEQFIELFFKSSEQPLGKVTDYFIRVEMQKRGSPHIHLFLWVEASPIIGKQSDSEVVSFIDKYISCEIPLHNEELKSLVLDLQNHKCNKYCMRVKKNCRFGFPRPPCSKTMVCTGSTEDNDIQNTDSSTLKRISQLLSLTDVAEDMNEFLHLLHMSESFYEKLINRCYSSSKVIVKHKPNESRINNYNAASLLAWQANCDIQYVVGTYACVYYITSYMTKAENQMSKLLKATAEENYNIPMREQLTKLGKVYLNEREVSAQEAAIQVLSLPLQKCSRAIKFIPTNLCAERACMLKSHNDISSLDDESADIFQKGLPEHYANRPDVLETVCYAEFAAYFSVGKYCANVCADSDNEFNNEFRENESDGQMKLSTGQVISKRRVPSIIRYHRVSELKNPDQYYLSQLMLYHPWRCENDLLHVDGGYIKKYQECLNLISAKRQIFEQNTNAIDKAVHELQNAPTHELWDQVATNIETETSMTCSNEIRLPEDLSELFLNPFDNDRLEVVDVEIQNEAATFAGSTISRLEKNRSIMQDNEYRALIRSLNSEQRDLHEIFLQWCFNSKSSGNYEQMLIALMGSGGTGKSHVIRAITETVNRQLRVVGDTEHNAEHVLLMAPTGIAAFNISGYTIHSALRLQIRTSQYKTLSSDETRELLRQTVGRKRLIIIDEFSMVGAVLNSLISMRLNDVCETGDDSIYGGISILYVGDPFQLKAVAQQPMHAHVHASQTLLSLSTPLWHHFKKYELKMSMRQRDNQLFGDLLNRVRIGEQTDVDIALLESRVITSDTEETLDALHVFTTNKAKNAYNDRRLDMLPSEIISIRGQHSTNDAETGSAPVRIRDDMDVSITGGLHYILHLKIGAKVMLTRNVDVSEGLTNGAQGTVASFVKHQNEVCVLVEFCREDVGVKYKVDYQGWTGVVPIKRQEAQFTIANSNVTLKQVPLTLAFAATIHKVQGLTLDKIVVDFNGKFSAGQAYVALSRVRSLEGLFLMNFNSSKITSCASVAAELQRMDREAKFNVPRQLREKEKKYSISFLNIRSLRRHMEDVKSDNYLQRSDFICFAETMLHQHVSNEEISLPGFNIMRFDNYLSSRHGLAVYKNNNSREFGHCEVVSSQLERFTDIISLRLYLNSPHQFLLIFVYRSPNTPMDDFLQQLSSAVSSVGSNEHVVVMGDFNSRAINNIVDESGENINSLQYFFNEKGFTQLVKSPTHASGSLLDHVYIHDQICHQCDFNTPTARVEPKYYTDHCCIELNI